MANRNQEQSKPSKKATSRPPPKPSEFTYRDDPPPQIEAVPEGKEKPAEFTYRDDPPPHIEAAAEDDETQVEGEEAQENEGEGNRSADRNYRRGVKKHLETHDIEREGRDAANAMNDDEEAKDLEEAEDKGRRSLH